ncbi:MAG: YfhO family protein [Acidobacteria bacterium]|nr:YfhO family protein [Acidobacteriota bacterium]
MAHRIHRAGTALLLLALTIGFYWKLTLTKQYEWTTGEDLATQVLPWFQTQARQIQQGELPLWDSYPWNGQPLAAQMQPGSFYPLNWLLFLSPLQDGRLRPGYLGAYRVLLHFVALVFCYRLCRSLGLSRSASALGGSAFAFDGFVGTSPWPQWVNGACWAPLVLLYQLRALAGHRPVRNAALSGAGLGAAFLSGHPQVPLFLAIVSLGVWIWRKRLWQAGISAAFMALIAAAQLLPGIEFGRAALRWVGYADPVAWNQRVPYEVHEKFSFVPTTILGFIYPSGYFHADPHMGAVCVVLALLGLAAAWHRPEVRVLAAVAGAGLVIAMGGWSLVQGLLYALIPDADKARNPATAIFLTNTALAALAAVGLDHLQRGTGSWSRHAVWALTGIGVSAMAAIQFVHGSQGEPAIGITAAAALIAAGTIEAWRRGALPAGQSSAILIALAVTEFAHSTAGLLAPRGDRDRNKWNLSINGFTAFADYIRQQPGRFRIDPGETAMPKNWGAWHGIEMWGGYQPAVLEDPVRYELGAWEPRLLYGVQFSVGKAPTAGFQQEVAREGEWRLYYNPGTFPRVWIVSGIIRSRGRDETNEIIRTRLTDLYSAAIVENQPVPDLTPCLGEGGAEIEEHRASRIRIRAKMPCLGMVVLSETWFAGWTAEIDGKPALVYRVNGGMRAVVVPAGTHQVEMRYRPRAVYYGAGITLLGLAALVVVCRRW